MNNAQDIADQIIAQFTSRLGDVPLGDVEKQLVTQCAVDAAALSIAAQSTPRTPAGDEQLAAEARQITAQMKNVEAALEVSAVNVFWDSVRSVAGRVIEIAAAAAVGAL